MLDQLFPNVVWDSFWNAVSETLYMVVIATAFTFVIGILLGLLLYLTARGNPWQNSIVYGIVGAIVNVFRAIPFIILILLLLPITKFITGTIFGPSAALPALIIGAAPFYARLVEIGLREVDRGVVEAAEAMGSSNRHIVFKVLLPESMPALVSGITVTTVALIGFTAMAGIIGGGGLGTFAYQQGFQRNAGDVMMIATIAIVAIVFLFQWIGDFITNRLDKR
ncbi:D-methionine transport system permease protein [Alkalihalobacillus xiaoxiensis]|uniref:D-methionine transport system permease protein n=1 Tax=Shouchella xiaoxiensis TaxID=766895 RepID=A0ABS2SZ80_9BACI|nr:methionine ABC transporter permease [Shouchella xiaoxiensis]MBM7840526.1 D-methionine transport system permease protein [Shouchella xiaoxiensis]